MKLRRIRLRTLLLLIFLVALAMRLEMIVRLHRAQRRAIDETRMNGGWVRIVAGPQWARRLLGEDFFAELTRMERHQTMKNRGFPKALDLSKLCGISLPYVPVTDDDLPALHQAANLEVLYLCEDQLTDAGLMQLVGLRRLRELQLGPLAVNEPGRTYFGPSPVTEDGLERLRRAIPGLKVVRNVAPPGWSVSGLYFPSETSIAEAR